VRGAPEISNSMQTLSPPEEDDEEDVLVPDGRGTGVRIEEEEEKEESF